jgi:hypothetical protein
MKPLPQAIAIVQRAEDELRNLLLRVAGEGEYDQVAMLADWAQQLRQIREHAGSATTIDGALELCTLRSGTNQKSQPFTNSAPRNETPKPRNPGKAVTSRAKKADYPRFRRDRDELVKIGWSKKERAEYRHKAPKAVVMSVSEVLQRRGAGGERFTFEELLPFRDRETNAELPSYQSYLTLAWLRKENLIVQHGRQGYSLPPNIDLMDALEERWKLLPKA